MKFIFPQNYSFKSKIWGVLDYSTAIFNVFWCIFIFLLIQVFTDLYLKILLFILFCFPIFLISFIGINHENFLYVIYYLFKFFKNRKIYLYIK